MALNSEMSIGLFTGGVASNGKVISGTFRHGSV